MDPARLAELGASIRESGIVQPILVRRRGERYQIIAGERRFRAAQAIGLASVPVTVREVADEHLLELALVENIQREELNAIEEAQAFHRLQDEFRLTQEEIARRVGRDRTTVANTLRLLRLPRELREMVVERPPRRRARPGPARPRPRGRPGRARPGGGAQGPLRARGRAARGAPAGAARVRTASARKDANTRAAEERLRGALGARVEIARRGRGGQIRVLFAGEAELNRLFELLVRAGRGR